MSEPGAEKWGPTTWKFIHIVATAYPNNPTEEQKQYYKNFFHSIPYIIPCHKCSANFKKNLVELPLTEEIFQSRDYLLDWTIDMHNLVNKELGKPVLTYMEAMDKIYSNFE